MIPQLNINFLTGSHVHIYRGKKRSMLALRTTLINCQDLCKSGLIKVIIKSVYIACTVPTTVDVLVLNVCFRRDFVKLLGP